jgi:urease accessory protein
MVTVGILAVILDAAIVVPATFVGAMVIGGALGMMGMPFPFTEAAIAVSVVALGGALVAGESMRADLALGLVALAGLVHGHAHGAEAPNAIHPAAYVLGFVLATASLHASGVAVGFGIRQRTAFRATIGTLVAATGLGLLVAIT